MPVPHGPAWEDISDSLAAEPDFLDKSGLEYAWRPDPDGFGTHSPKFGLTRTRVALDPHTGERKFSRTILEEGPHINAGAYYWAGDLLMVGVSSQVRQFAHNPDGSIAITPIVFAQLVMGFNLPMANGARLGELAQSGEDSAVEEALQEMGVREVLDIDFLGVHYVNPTCVATPTPFYALHINPQSLTGEFDRSEWITKVEFIPFEVLWKRIKAVDEHGLQGFYEGVCYRADPFITGLTILGLHHGVL